MTNADQCRAKVESGECPGHLYFTVPAKIARCKRSRVWVEGMKTCKLGLWKAEPKPRRRETATANGLPKPKPCGGGGDPNDSDSMAYHLEEHGET